MFLVVKQRIVAHGDDNYYKFEVLEPIGVVNTKEDAEKYIAAMNASFFAALKAHKEGLSAHNRAWKDTHPKPVDVAFIPAKKWGVVKNADITPEMRAERESIKAQNEQIRRENAKAFSKWLNDLEMAEAEYLEQNKPPKRQRFEFKEIQQLFV